VIAARPAPDVLTQAGPRPLTPFGPAASGEPPLCVDLDGTLLATDLLWESVASLARTNPLALLLLPVWLLSGRAYAKARIAERVRIDAAHLPYREPVLLFLIQETARGRRLVLATASPLRLARLVADHLGLFDDVIGSDDRSNLKGVAKLRSLEAKFGVRGFDYVGDATCDVPIWEASRRAYVAGGRRGIQAAVRRVRHDAQFVTSASLGRTRGVLRLLRPHQWAKNLLLFVPLILAHLVGDLSKAWAVTCAFVAFCCFASAVYVLNDLADLEADRRHPSKKRRPLASGAVPLPWGSALAALLLVAGIVIPIAAGLPPAFFGLLALYLVVTTAYSLHLKRVVLLDVFVLAGLYALRVTAGGAAVGVPVTGWLTAFSMFFFVSLALAKRYAEMSRAAADRRPAPDRRGYRTEDIDLIRGLGPAAGCVAVLPLCLYVNSADVLRLYVRPELLWVVCLVVFYWIARVWLLACRGQLHEDPVTFALKDRASYAAGAVVGLSLLLAGL